MPPRGERAFREWTDTSWMDDAECRGYPTGLWFADDPHTAAEAKAICATCRVQPQCYRFALESPAVERGIWGGTSERQRASLRSQHRAESRVNAAEFDPYRRSIGAS